MRQADQTLLEYLAENEESQNAFARRSTVPQSVVSRICLGGDAHGKNWALIAEATGGRVTAESHFRKLRKQQPGEAA